MKRNYVEVAQFLQSKFQGLQISGELYPAPPVVEFIGNVFKLFQMIGIAWMVIGGDKLLRMVGFRGPLPAFYWTIQDNPVPVAIFLFLLAPQFLSRYQANGAFEIYLDDTQIFSKLARKSFPTVDDLVDPLLAAGLTYTK
jgi:selT/selW/selH-like putative selenoprotein